MSNTTRPLSVIRRRPNLVDILVPKDPAVQGYRLQGALNFDIAFTTMLTAPISSGHLDPAVDRRKLHTVNNPDHIRIVFDPQTYNAGAPNLVDANQFWLKYQPVDFAGAPGTASAPMLILAEDNLRGDSRIAIAGDAPSGASVANSLTLHLPLRMQGLVIRNNDGADELLVAFQPGGPETTIPALTTMSFLEGAQGCLLVRGDGAVVNFSASFTSHLPL